MNEQQHEQAHQEMIAAEVALADGRYDAAEHHLEAAHRLGASQKQVEKVASSIRRSRQRGEKQGLWRARIGFAVGLCCYLLLAIQPPLSWRIPLWIFLAFLLVPAVIGLVIGRMYRAAQPAPVRFGEGMRAGGWAMAIYTGLSLMVFWGRMGRDAEGEEFVAGALTTVVFALLAGIVAGFVGKLAAKRPAKNESP